MGRLNDLEVEDYLQKATEIDPLCIQEEYVRLPADLAYWNQRYAVAYRTHARERLARKRLEALLAIQYRETFADEGKRPTEAMVAAAVSTDERLDAALGREVEAEVEKVRLYGVLDAVRAKREMLVSLGAHIRQEMQHDPTIRAQHARGKVPDDPLGDLLRLDEHQSCFQKGSIRHVEYPEVVRVLPGGRARGGEGPRGNE